MANFPKVQEQNIAVFGEAGSGKTVLVSSFYGPTQESAYQNDLWDLVALQPGQGNRLLQSYLEMRDTATMPIQNRFSGITYQFAVKLKTTSLRESTKRPFDELRLMWHDYPGEWFTTDPEGDEEQARRLETWGNLLKSDVALILVDGQKLLDFRGEEERYLTSLFANYRQNILLAKDHLLAKNGPLVEFPRIWILALSKSDLHPGWTVESFRDLLIRKSAGEMNSLRETIASLLDTPKALSLGEDFLLLSSAKFQMKPGGYEPSEIDLTQRVGVDLVLPLASILPLERRVQWQQQFDIPLKVVDKLADGADVIAAALLGMKFKTVEKLFKNVAKTNKAIGVFTQLTPILAAAVAAAGPKLKEINAEARDRHDHLRSMLTQFKLDLEQSVTDNVALFRK
ncbi:TRAFAC clade GTPase domain-containing protein [Dietzia cercidiphylli]|uniref:ATP-binding protein n=1 Tax=Dietzia cercidiphylli TaxID=498199 RepID=A0ABP4V2V4_9ACTN|nr:ATP/GTP-binding protein [Dietzia cercidiphylli]MBB1047759.1 ATP/GTP-binding protein [Dietzia cercidiphylli]